MGRGAEVERVTGPAQRVEVVYKISERRRRKHQGFVLGYGPSGFEFVFFYTENRLRGYGGRLSLPPRTEGDIYAGNMPGAGAGLTQSPGDFHQQLPYNEHL